jgi:Na+/alanine symporter
VPVAVRSTWPSCVARTTTDTTIAMSMFGNSLGVHAAVGGAEGCRLQACVLHGAHRGVHGGAERGAAAASEAGLRASERG